MKRKFNNQLPGSLDVKRIHPHGMYDALAWGCSFNGEKTKRMYYSVFGNRLHNIDMLHKADSRGTIVLPSKVCGPITGARLKYGQQIKSFFKDVLFQLLDNDMPCIRQEVNQNDVFYSIGNFFKRNYKHEEHNEFFSEDLLSIEVIGIPFQFLILLAVNMGQYFGQASVLIKVNGEGIFLAGCGEDDE